MRNHGGPVFILVVIWCLLAAGVSGSTVKDFLQHLAKDPAATLLAINKAQGVTVKYPDGREFPLTS